MRVSNISSPPLPDLHSRKQNGTKIVRVNILYYTAKKIKIILSLNSSEQSLGKSINVINIQSKREDKSYMKVYTDKIDCRKCRKNTSKVLELKINN